MPDFLEASINFAEVQADKASCSAIFHILSGPIERFPSNSTIFACTASEDTSQFHIIHPQVVK